MSFTAVIPARLASTRLHEKSLALLGGKAMVLHVLEQAQKANAQRVIATTDAQRIKDLVTAAGFEVALTGKCRSGTERVATTVRALNLTGIIVNIQGDEPEISPQLIRDVVTRVQVGDCACATAAAPISAETANDANVVKVVLQENGLAALFSRSCIPYHVSTAVAQQNYLGHIGIYAFAPGRLDSILNLPPCELETVERLEQLRWLWHGWPIAVVVTDKFSHGIDTPADFSAANTRLQKKLTTP